MKTPKQDRSDGLKKLGELKELGEKLKTAKKTREPVEIEDRTGWAIGINYASIFIGAIFVGSFIGYGVDHYTNTKPWGLIIGMMFGFAAGTRSIVLMAKDMIEQDED